jgi:hypothetical protein
MNKSMYLFVNNILINTSIYIFGFQMNYLICNMNKDRQRFISSLKRDIMWNGCEVSHSFMNIVHEKSVQWLCVNPNEISTNIRHIQNEQCEEQSKNIFNCNIESLMLRIKVLKYKKKRLQLLRRKLTLTHKMLKKMK